MEAVRTLKANLKLEGKPCGWCQVPLKIGEDTSVCTACEKEHHGRCWDSKAGCSTAGCANAPLKQLDVPAASVGGVAAAAALAPGLMHCPSCRTPIPVGAMLCPVCRAITSPDGIYHGPKINAPGAVQSLVYGIIGFFICGIILGPIAISKSNSAKQAIASDPTLTGSGLATAGMIMGILDIVGWAIIMMMRMSSR
jgi:hypothetical protein